MIIIFTTASGTMTLLHRALQYDPCVSLKFCISSSSSLSFLQPHRLYFIFFNNLCVFSTLVLCHSFCWDFLSSLPHSPPPSLQLAKFHYSTFSLDCTWSLIKYASFICSLRPEKCPTLFLSKFKWHFNHMFSSCSVRLQGS